MAKSHEPYRRISPKGLIDISPSTLYTLEEARRIIAEEQRVYVVVKRPPTRKPVGRNAPRKCLSGLNWVSWL